MVAKGKEIETVPISVPPRGSAGEFQADEQAGVTRLRWRVSGR